MQEVYCFPKSVRLRKRRQYQRMAYHAKRYVGCLVVIDTRTNSNSITRLGITVSRRYGKAHDRNRFKRIVKEAFRLCRHQLIPGLDLNIKPRSMAHHVNMQSIRDEIVRLLALPV